MEKSTVARIQGELHEVRMAVERDRALWHSRMDTMEMAVEQTLELVQEARFAFKLLAILKHSGNKMFPFQYESLLSAT